MDMIKLIIEISSVVATFFAVLVALRANYISKKNSINEIAEMKEQNKLMREQESRRVLEEKIEAATIISTVVPQVLYSLCISEYPPVGINFKCDYSKYLSVLKDELTKEELQHLAKIFSYFAYLNKISEIDSDAAKAYRKLRDYLLDGFPGEKEYCINMSMCKNNKHCFLPHVKLERIDNDFKTMDIVMENCNSAYCKSNKTDGIHIKLEKIASQKIKIGEEL